MNNHRNNFLLQDVAIIILSVLVAVVLVRTEVVIKLLTSAKELEMLGSFVAGMFFTSIFTTAPAIVALGEIANANSVFITALFGGMGALVGDLIIFKFIKNRLSEHLMELIKHQSGRKRLRVLFKLKYFRWLTIFLGGAIIASPLPDELGIGLLGFSKMRTSLFVVLSFSFNFVGIALIGLIAKSL